MTIEYRVGGGSTSRVASSQGGARIGGYAIVFNQIADIGGEFLEQILPAAVDRACRAADVRMLWSHDQSIVLARTAARTLRLEKRAEGLYFDASLTPWAAEQYGQTIARGDVSGTSFGFSVVADRWTVRSGRPFRQVEDLILHEVSPVAWPAYSATSVTTIDRAAPRRLTAATDRRLFRLRVA